MNNSAELAYPKRYKHKLACARFKWQNGNYINHVMIDTCLCKYK